jgi:hypothetical protein
MRMAIFVFTLAATTACAADGPPRPSTPSTAKAEAKESRRVALKNPGFENPAGNSERCPEGWHCTMHSNPESFVFRVESPGGAQGKQALCIERVIPEPWALVTQAVPAAALKGEKLRFSVALRVDRAEGAGAGAWAVVHGPTGNLAHEERLLKATRGWERVEVDFPVAAAAQLVEVGATMQGGGRVCIDEARLEIRAP